MYASACIGYRSPISPSNHKTFAFTAAECSSFSLSATSSILSLQFSPALVISLNSFRISLSFPLALIFHCSLKSFIHVSNASANNAGCFRIVFPVCGISVLSLIPMLGMRNLLCIFNVSCSGFQTVFNIRYPYKRMQVQNQVKKKKCFKMLAAVLRK